MSKRITKTVLAATTVGLSAYELWTLVNKDAEDTLSEGIVETADNYPILAVESGILMGHWFHRKIWLFVIGCAIGATVWKLRTKEKE